VPPLEEQCELVKAIEDEATAINETIKRAQKEISLLHEYRTRLIADVVTGKLDVREAAVRLPDKADEPELVDGGGAMSAVEDEPVDDLDTVQEEVEA